MSKKGADPIAFVDARHGSQMSPKSQGVRNVINRFERLSGGGIACVSGQRAKGPKP